MEVWSHCFVSRAFFSGHRVQDRSDASSLLRAVNGEASDSAMLAGLIRQQCGICDRFAVPDDPQGDR
jgi:hypothetical protein